MQHSFPRGDQSPHAGKRPTKAFAVPRTLAAIGLVALILDLLIR